MISFICNLFLISNTHCLSFFYFFIFRFSSFCLSSPIPTSCFLSLSLLEVGICPHCAILRTYELVAEVQIEKSWRIFSFPPSKFDFSTSATLTKNVMCIVWGCLVNLMVKISAFHVEGPKWIPRRGI